MWAENQQATAKYTNGGAASIGISGNTLTPSMPLDELSKQLEGACSRVASLTDRARVVADSLFGSEPEQKGSGANVPPLNGRINGLNSQASTIHFWLTELEHQIARLNPLG